MSDFWKRVDEELDYLGKNRAYLSRKCGFSLANIGKGIKLGSTPSADTAVKIAQVLGVSVEYLVNGTNKATEADDTVTNRLTGILYTNQFFNPEVMVFNPEG